MLGAGTPAAQGEPGREQWGTRTDGWRGGAPQLILNTGFLSPLEFPPPSGMLLELLRTLPPQPLMWLEMPLLGCEIGPLFASPPPRWGNHLTPISGLPHLTCSPSLPPQPHPCTYLGDLPQHPVQPHSCQRPLVSYPAMRVAVGNPHPPVLQPGALRTGECSCRCLGRSHASDTPTGSR